METSEQWSVKFFKFKDQKLEPFYDDIPVPNFPEALNQIARRFQWGWGIDRAEIWLGDQKQATLEMH